MAWYTINYTCGHTERVQLYGAHKDRYAKIEAMERRACPECEAKAAQEQAASDGLPALTGSDRQISWAADIRARWLALPAYPGEVQSDAITPTAKRLINYLVDRIGDKTDNADTAQDWMAAALDYIGVQTDYKSYDPAMAMDGLRRLALEHTAAKWWIDNRGSIGRVMAAEIIDNVSKEAAND